jgi:hypothetical protein
MYSASDLKYPVLHLSSAADAGIAATADELTTSYVRLVRAHFYDGLHLVDATGRDFEISSARIIRPRTALGQVVARLFMLPVRMELALQPSPAIKLTDLRAKVLATMEQEPEAVEEDTGQSLAWWRQHLADVPSKAAFVLQFAAAAAAR